ncbi:autophagy protein Atg8 ubiquitin-like protein [Hokovirus HKV1]|uniref:Autophagy protein Atg8 ubiquitin-like protein n=1 Tax=Hokovirus HKV1 TaxID=1977638 RepID=A0A1V0SH55_9VIRU|nr:autophagy protein Atg8 ubiquitin-like protein [Hokovirus HKV1]
MLSYFSSNTVHYNRYKLRHTEEERKNDVKVIMQEATIPNSKCYGRLPLIIEPSIKILSRLSDNKIKSQYLIKKDCDIVKLKKIIHSIYNVDSSETIILTVGDNCRIPNNNDTIEYLYNNYKDSDGYLYITYSIEDFFG